MTFNAYPFLFLFLPIVVAGYYLLTRVVRDTRPALVWLVAASLFFYGVYGPGYLLVLVGSVLGNFAVAWFMTREGSRRRAILITGVLANLVLVATYKYTGFFADNINALVGS